MSIYAGISISKFAILDSTSCCCYLIILALLHMCNLPPEDPMLNRLVCHNRHLITKKSTVC